jgi:hypothetical protein
MFVWKDLPDKRPKYLRDKLVIAWVAYHSQSQVSSRGKAECHLAIRFLEMIFSFSSQSVAEASLKRLRRSESKRKSGWLVVSTRATGVTGNRYALGARARGDSSAWFEAGEMLFGPGGVLEGYRTRPIFRSKAIGPEGCIVLAAIEKCGPIPQRDVIQLLSTYLSESTVKKRIKNLIAEKLIIQKDNKLFTSRTLAKKVEDFEHRYDLIDDHLKHHASLLGESLAYQVGLQGGPQLVTLKAALRKLPCIYCAKAPRPKGEEVEHFPPKRWGGSDKLSILLPACVSCNHTFGALLGKHPRPLIEKPLTEMRLVVDIGMEELDSWLAQSMILAAHRYAIAMVNRDIDGAYFEASSTFPVKIWMALRSGLLLHITPGTGEISIVESRNSLDVRPNLDELAGIASKLWSTVRINH